MLRRDGLLNAWLPQLVALLPLHVRIGRRIIAAVFVAAARMRCAPIPVCARPEAFLQVVQHVLFVHDLRLPAVLLLARGPSPLGAAAAIVGLGLCVLRVRAAAGGVRVLGSPRPTCTRAAPSACRA